MTMVDTFNRVIAALSEIDGLDVIQTSDEADEPSHTLPAVVLDFEGSPFLPVSEDGQTFVVNPTFSMVIYSDNDAADRAGTRARLFDLIKQVLRQLLVACPHGFELGQSYIGVIPFGAGEARAFSCTITTGEEAFAL
jgi:hypothetical protein